MKTLVILQAPAYGDERAYNGLRLADWTLWSRKSITNASEEPSSEYDTSQLARAFASQTML